MCRTTTETEPSEEAFVCRCVRSVCVASRDAGGAIQFSNLHALYFDALGEGSTSTFGVDVGPDGQRRPLRAFIGRFSEVRVGAICIGRGVRSSKVFGWTGADSFALILRLQRLRTACSNLAQKASREFTAAELVPLQHRVRA
jgi:hypothetical protein